VQASQVWPITPRSAHPPSPPPRAWCGTPGKRGGENTVVGILMLPRTEGQTRRRLRDAIAEREVLRHAPRSAGASRLTGLRRITIGGAKRHCDSVAAMRLGTV